MTQTNKNIGSCFICNKENISYRAITNHVTKCFKAKNKLDDNDTGNNETFLIHLVSYKIFWLYVEAPAQVELRELDSFLRDIWLECCGHLSCFENGEHRYENVCDNTFGLPSFGPPPEDMSLTLKQFFLDEEKFNYQYDYGSTTEISGKLIGIRKGMLKNNQIRVLARNTLPELECQNCGALPVSICSACFNFVCKKCKKKHTCEGGEYLLPIVNSPRMGVCGYTG